jgi:p-aminobenzoyl-glutamate transporter AbgT
MQKTKTSRKRFRLYALLSTVLLALGAGAATMAGVSPALAADIAHQPDAQVAVFMVPLTLLVLTILFEAARVVLRGSVPEQAPARRARVTNWRQSRQN